MNKFDKYYLKQGKLELSILDEDDEQVDKKYIHHEEDNRETREPRIKLTEDICNTLQTMGKFLTKKMGDELNTSDQEESLGDEFDENLCIAPKWNKIVRQEAFKSIQARQLEEAVKSVYVKAAEEAEDIDINITKPEELKEIPQIKLEIPKKEDKVEVTSAKAGIFEEDEDDDKELAQSSIDQILLEYFGDTKPQYEYAKRLKRHIDKRIYLIENYQ